jgi:hypothetical protein
MVENPVASYFRMSIDEETIFFSACTADAFIP